MINEKDYEKFKEKIKKRIDKMYEEFEFNIMETKEEVFEHFWENVNLNRAKLDEPPVEWKPMDKKLRLWNE